MRTRSQLGAWAQAKQLAMEQQLAFQEFERQQQLKHAAAAKLARRAATAQRKRKLQVATSDAAVTTSAQTAPLLATVCKRSIADYISPNAKKAKVEAQSDDAAHLLALTTPAAVVATQASQQPIAFKTPMKKRPLFIDTRRSDDIPLQSVVTAAAAAAAASVGEPKSILDYISPTSKKATATSVLDATAAAASTPPPAAPAASTGNLNKRTAIRRTLSYSSSDDVFSDASVETLDDSEPIDAELAVSAAASDAERILHRVCSARGGSQQPLSLVGRATEQAAIAAVLGLGAADAPRSPNLFIIGPPGTGKSSSVHELLATYEQRFPANAVVRVNCSMFTNPVALYAEVDAQLRRLSPWTLPYLDPCLLDEFLDTASHAQYKCETVLVLDEVDQLLRLPPIARKRVQDVLRFFVQWSTLPTAHVTFVGIMNGVDMHAQLTAILPQDTAVPHVLFPAYTFSELLAILTAHVQHAATTADGSHNVDAVVEQRALELIARKVASRDGDVRRAIGLLQQCARRCLRRSSDGECNDVGTAARYQITLRDVLACTSSMLAAGPVRDVHQLPRVPKILLFVITSLAPSGSKACTMAAVSTELAQLRATPGFAWVPAFPRDELQAHLAALECYALVKRPARSATKAFWATNVTSAVTRDTVDRAIQDDPLLATLLRGVNM